MVDNLLSEYQTIAEIAEKAKTFTDVEEMIKFVEEENSRLSHPFELEELNKLLNTISTYIIKNSKAFNPDKCLEELHSIIPKAKDGERAQQALKFVGNNIFFKDGDLFEMQLFIEDNVYEHFQIPKSKSSSAGNIFRSGIRDLIKKKRKAVNQKQKGFDDEDGPELNMDSTSGRNEAYHLLARDFMETHKVKYVAGTLRSFTDGIYPASEEAVSFIMSEIMKISLEKYNTPLSKNHVESVIKVLEMYTPVKLEDCDSDASNVIVLNNGILDLRNFKFTKGHDPEKVYLSKIPVDYDPKAPEPTLFKKYLATTFKGHESRIKILQELTGYLLLRSYKYQHIFYLLGDGGNGKGTYLMILDYLLGKENTTAFSLFQLTDHNNVDYNIAQMHGKYANICGDVGTKKVENTEHIKKLSSGTDPISARNPYGKPFKFINHAKIVLAMNKLPKKNAFTTGDKRRDLIIAFDNRVSENSDEVKDMARKIREAGEMPGILNWAIEGLKRLESQEGFSDERTIAERGLEYDRKSNPIYYFVDDCIVEDPGAYLPNALIYQRYSEYRKLHGMPELSQEDIKRDVLFYCNQLGMNVSETKHPTRKMFSESALPTMKTMLGENPRVFKNIKLVEKKTKQMEIEGTVDIKEKKKVRLVVLKEAFKEHERRRRAFKIIDTRESFVRSFMEQHPGEYGKPDVEAVVNKMTEFGELLTFARV